MTPFSSSPAASTSNSVDEPEVLFDSQGSRRIITLNRPKSLNACTLNMEWDESKEVDLVIIKAAGDKAFCAGGDAIAVVTSAKDALAGGKSTVHRDFFKEEFVMNHLINTFSKPYLAFADGIVFGGGLGLAVIGSFCIVTERTLLSMPETQLGLFPDIGAGYFLSRLKTLQMEFRISQRIALGPDLHEGCRAILIDKDRNPKWNPARLEDVTKDKVDGYFTALPENEELKL
ncbi:hypothetical protein WR25_23810 [Diploscapter pachys]|uniref:3-hydroxyisobutyryl-CoA hydrolase, mitochondrial n=1 Tax=Diploscapter pachys TaxID=2018661 RepID=A0A2A2J865_9BILA|nr:hypothetical protein WR25_23810 [Diploscapter pachys]